jgi:effector-binding domain-containing protein
MNTMDKNLSEIFDVSPLNEKKPKTEVVTTHYNEPNMDEDLTDAYQQSKENLQGIIDSGKDAMEEILQIAKAGQHPRAFEVYGGILKNMVDANKELLAIQKQIRSMDDSKKESKSQTNIDKAIFVGSTTELQKLLKNKE